MVTSLGLIECGDSRGLAILAHAKEEEAQHGNRAEDDDEPHFRKHPCVQREDRVGQVRSLRNRGNGDCLVDARDAGTADEIYVSCAENVRERSKSFLHQTTTHDKAQAQLHSPFLI